MASKVKIVLKQKMKDKEKKGKSDFEEQEEKKGKEKKKKEEKEKTKEKETIKEEKEKEQIKEIREIPSEHVQEFRARTERTERVVPILRPQERRLEDSLAEVPTPKKKEEKKYEIKPGYEELDKEERKYTEFWEGEREKAREIVPRIERVTELLPRKRTDAVPVVPAHREEGERIERLEETKEFVKYEERGREPFEDELDWSKRERKIKKYKKH